MIVSDDLDCSAESTQIVSVESNGTGRKGSVFREYHSDANAQYVLPNDSVEHQRLEQQAARIAGLMDGKVIHAPLRKGDAMRCLDVGCGTGVVTDLMAQNFAEAECIGLDLSLVPASIRARKPSVRFFQGNVLTETPSQWRPSSGESQLLQDSEVFDYVYSRLLILGMSDWNGYIKTVFKLLKPGGWAEIHDLNWQYFDDGGLISDEWSWLNTLRVTCEGKKGLDFKSGSNAAERMRQAGFEDVQVIGYKWPFGGEYETDPKLREFGLWHAASQPAMIHKMIKRTMMEESSQLDHKTEEVVESLRREARNCLTPQRGYHQKFFVTIGRKPS